MEIVEIKPGIFACLMANKTSNSGFVVTERGVVVIDALDSPARGRELASAIRAHTDRPILFLINTHCHHDHVLGNQAFGCPVVAHCALAGVLADRVARNLSPDAIAAWVAEHPEDRWLAEELEIVYPNIIFEHRLVLDLPPALLVLRHLGGHTADSSIVDLPDEGLVFAGDLVFEGRLPYLGDARFRDLIGALGELESLGDRIVVPGHGALCDMDYVTRTRAYIEALLAKASELVALGWSKTEVLESGQLPQWWTDAPVEKQRMNLARLYDEVAGSTAELPH